MKSFKYLTIFIAASFFFWNGCSDTFTLPDEPVTGELQKVTITNFTATETFNTILNPGIMKMMGQNIIVKGSVIQSSFESGNNLINGVVIVTGNGRLNLNTGEGPVHGVFTLTPVDEAGGVWKGNWTGYRRITGSMEWTTKAHLVAHGEGSAIDGMMFYADEEIVSNQPAGGSYTGKVSGYIKLR